jgi:hypothetical protein
MLILHSSKFLRTAAFGAASILVTSLSSPAQAVKDPFNDVTLNWYAPKTSNGRAGTVSIFVVPDQGGDVYTRVSAQPLEATFAAGASVKNHHRIYGYAVAVGAPADPRLFKYGTPPPYHKGAFDVDHEGKKHISRLVKFELDAATALIWGSSNKITGANRAQEVVAKCNETYGGVIPAGREQPLGETYPIEVFLMVSAGKKKASGGVLTTDGWVSNRAGDVIEVVHRTIDATVYCTTDEYRSSELSQKPLNVDIRAKQKGDTCPKDSEVTAYIDYDRPTTARFWIVRNGRRGKKFTVKSREISLAGKTWHRVERMQSYKLDPGISRFQVEVEGGSKSKSKVLNVTCPPFKVFSTWLKYEVAKTPYCPKQVKETTTFKTTQPGSIPYRIKVQGGLVAHEGITLAKREGDAYVAKVTRTLSMNEFDKDMMAEVKGDSSANSGWTRLKVDCLDVVGATLTLRDKNGPSCKRQEKAAIAIRTDLEGPVPYRLDCTGGRSFTGTAAAYKTGNGKFIGVDMRKLAITKTEHINCALKTTIKGNTKIVALRGHKYKCVNRNVGSASNDVSSVPDPSHDRPKPNVVFDPIPNFKCVNGRKVGGKCKCRRGHRLVRLNGRRYRCDKEKPDVASPPPTRIPDPKVVSCRNGRKIKGKCKCRRGHRLVRIGSWHYRCEPGRAVAKGSDKTSRDTAADRRRRAALKKAQEAKRRAEAKRKRDAAKKAAEVRRMRKKAEQARRRRDAARKALEAKRKAAAKRRSSMRGTKPRRHVVR